MKSQKKHLILINFKRVSGDQALRLAMELEKIDNRTRESFDIALALQRQDIPYIPGNISLSVFIQDREGVTPDGIDKNLIAGGHLRGVILNHPEKKLSPAALDKKFAWARETGLEIMLCASNLHEGFMLNQRFNPEYIALENEQLIGKDISICEYCPDSVKEATAKIPNRVLFGGGIRTPRDIRFILEHGGAGVLIASLVIKSPHPLAALTGLLNPID